MNSVASDFLIHYGKPRRSGRYPWGSGDDPYQRTGDFLSRVEELKKNGWTETPENIKDAFGLTTTQYRTEKAICKDERRLLMVERARSLQDDGKGPTEIGREMGIPESSVRSLLNEHSATKMMEARKTADFIKSQIDTKGMVDVGGAVERELGISKEKLNQAIYLLEREGYPVYGGRFPQATNPGAWTTQKVICPPGTEHKAIYELDKIHPLNEDKYRYQPDIDGIKPFTYPKSMDPNRLMIRYKEDGGIEKDGVIELRRGVDDISLGDGKYAQVRILVDKDRYLKGMAVYSDKMPDGIDVVFNTNKTKDVPMRDVLKKIKDDPDNPFGSLIKENGQRWYTDKNGKEQLSVINKARNEGDWDEWADALPSQFLSKQSKAMIDKQLGLAKADKRAEFDEICSLTNPTVKKHLLEKFADGCDAAAVNLKAAALPGQKYHVLLPVNSLREDEVYAPGYKDGTKLALIRYPHGGTFEIPILKVNNKNADAIKMMGKTAVDAVGINHKVAERLSGADFDGDTAMCIPTHDRGGKVKITSTPPLDGLKDFDPKMKYGSYRVEKGSDGKEHAYDETGREFRLMTKRGTQLEMGKISNLISDMTLAGADDKQLARAVRHSMVVIDAEKHKLDYKRSEADNDIASLKKEWQEGGGGASTIISRAKGEASVDKRQGTPKINRPGIDEYDPSKPVGSLIYKTADDLYYPSRKYNKNTGIVELRTTEGKKITYDVKDPEARAKYEPVKTVTKGGKTYYGDKITNQDGSISYRVEKRKDKVTKMAVTDDAMTLVSKARHPKELAYADYANSMKALANQARKEIISTGKIEYSSKAKATYQKEVSSLMYKLNDAEMNRVKERAAQRKTVAEVSSKVKANPNMEKGDLRKVNQQTLKRYRDELGSVNRRKRNIDITDREWEAIQAGAISETQLKKILNNTDTAKLRERATPKTTNSISQAQANRIKAMSASYTIEQIADKLGISTSSVSKYLKGKS